MKSHRSAGEWNHEGGLAVMQEGRPVNHTGGRVEGIGWAVTLAGGPQVGRQSCWREGRALGVQTVILADGKGIRLAVILAGGEGIRCANSHTGRWKGYQVGSHTGGRGRH